ncbi:hypothetical protein [Streptomyces sp. NPDC101165]
MRTRRSASVSSSGSGTTDLCSATKTSLSPERRSPLDHPLPDLLGPLQ